jgi:hypothetical protein
MPLTEIAEELGDLVLLRILRLPGHQGGTAANDQPRLGARPETC